MEIYSPEDPGRASIIFREDNPDRRRNEKSESMEADPLEILAGLIAAGLIAYGISWIYRYLRWRYSGPKFESDNDDIEDKT